jgi:hypothetical protein
VYSAVWKAGRRSPLSRKRDSEKVGTVYSHRGIYTLCIKMHCLPPSKSSSVTQAQCIAHCP